MSTIKKTYLRYECADAFSVTCDATAYSSQIISHVGGGPPIVLCAAKSQCLAFHLRRGVPCAKIAHREPTNIGTGRALNSNEITCLTSASQSEVKEYLATGWADGSIRLFTLSSQNLQKASTTLNASNPQHNLGLVHSLLHPKSMVNDDFLMQTCADPLVLNGHGTTPVRCLALDAKSSRLASGGSDGAVIVWDIVAETGLFRLLGHKGGITHLSFVSPKGFYNQNQNAATSSANSSSFDGLISAGLDGMVKIWDLDAQCCVQTLTGHRSEVWAADCVSLQEDQSNSEDDDTKSVPRYRLITGSSDVQLRVWGLYQPKRTAVLDTSDEADDLDNVAVYMGSIHRQTNERASFVKFHPTGRLVAVLAHNSKVVEIYSVRTVKESEKKRKRRIRRRREKESSKDKKPIKKGGLLDDDEVPDNSEAIEDDLPLEMLKATDELDLVGLLRSHTKIKSFDFSPKLEANGAARLILALSSNALESHLIMPNHKPDEPAFKLLNSFDMYGHPTGIRSISLSSDESVCCSISKGAMKLWNVANRSCIRSFPLISGSQDAASSKKSNPSSIYGLCCAFLPGNSHIIVGSREGNLQIIDYASGEVVFEEPSAHKGAIWALDIRPDSESLVTGSADREVKFWDLELDETTGKPCFAHTRTLQMNDDVVAVKYSYSQDPTKRLVAVSSLDSTIKVFFDDSLKFFLSLYGHKLPALALDCSDDDTLLVSAGADKSIKIWGLDFGDTHRTLYGHDDSITDVKFVRRTHTFFTCSKDKTIRFWDADSFQQILLLSGHTAEINTLAVSRTGGFILSGGMDRQIRVWERTKDIVFIEEERERELEKIFDKEDGAKGNASINMTGHADAEDENDDNNEFPQSEAAVRRSVLSVAAGDRLAEAIELADQELKDRSSNPKRDVTTNPLLLNMEPPEYMLWVLRTIKSAELEQSLLLLPMSHMERLVYYMILLLRKGMGVELCAKVAVFLVRIHQNQIVANRSISTPLKELRRLVKVRVGESRDIVGYNMAAFKALARVAMDQKSTFVGGDETEENIWANMGLGSDVAAAALNRGKRRKVEAAK